MLQVQPRLPPNYCSVLSVPQSVTMEQPFSFEPVQVYNYGKGQPHTPVPGPHTSRHLISLFSRATQMQHIQNPQQTSPSPTSDKPSISSNPKWQASAQNAKKSNPDLSRPSEPNVPPRSTVSLTSSWPPSSPWAFSHLRKRKIHSCSRHSCSSPDIGTISRSTPLPCGPRSGSGTTTRLRRLLGCSQGPTPFRSTYPSISTIGIIATVPYWMPSRER